MKCCATIIICASITVLAAPVSCYAQSSQPKHKVSDSLEETVAQVLKRSNSPGGLTVVTGCSGGGVKASPALQGNTEDSLNSLAASNHALTWTTGIHSSHNAIVRYAPDVDPLSSIHVPAMHIEATTLSVATDALLSNSSVQAEIARLGFRQFSDEIGFSSVRQYYRTIDLPAGTLGDDLMIIAHNFGQAVWQLDQHVCEKKRSFRINWILSTNSPPPQTESR